MRAVVLTDALEFPVHLATPAGDDRLFVVEQRGRVMIIEDGVILAGHWMTSTLMDYCVSVFQRAATLAT